ncbi:hypothetical protein QTP88_013446 [Uroleucon formosanum]
MGPPDGGAPVVPSKLTFECEHVGAVAGGLCFEANATKEQRRRRETGQRERESDKTIPFPVDRLSNGYETKKKHPTDQNRMPKIRDRCPAVLNRGIQRRKQIVTAASAQNITLRM